MKRLFALSLVLISLYTLVGCNRISIGYQGNATLKFRGKCIGDNTQLTQLLTEEETQNAKEYLSSAVHFPGIAGCPFDEEISITFGNQVFAVAYDDCPVIHLVGTDQYYTISEEGRRYLISLFEKYVGYFPFP